MSQDTKNLELNQAEMLPLGQIAQVVCPCARCEGKKGSADDVEYRVHVGNYGTPVQ